MQAWNLVEKHVGRASELPAETETTILIFTTPLMTFSKNRNNGTLIDRS